MLGSGVGLGAGTPGFCHELWEWKGVSCLEQARWDTWVLSQITEGVGVLEARTPGFLLPQLWGMEGPGLLSSLPSSPLHPVAVTPSSTTPLAFFPFGDAGGGRKGGMS